MIAQTQVRLGPNTDTYTHADKFTSAHTFHTYLICAHTLIHDTHTTRGDTLQTTYTHTHMTHNTHTT